MPILWDDCQGQQQQWSGSDPSSGDKLYVLQREELERWPRTLGGAQKSVKPIPLYIWTTFSLSPHPLVDMYVGCVHFLATMNRAAMNMNEKGAYHNAQIKTEAKSNLLGG
ncbi:hypothetical protein STEG23_029795 [Scotinomys teguina]